MAAALALQVFFQRAIRSIAGSVAHCPELRAHLCLWNPVSPLKLAHTADQLAIPCAFGAVQSFRVLQSQFGKLENSEHQSRVDG